MLSELWLLTKWIKHFAVLIGSAHPSSWNVKINSQSKKSLFQLITNFPPQVFQSWFNPKYGYKTVNKRSQRKLTPGTAIRGNCHMSHFVKDQRLPKPYHSTPQSTYHISPWHLPHKTKTAHSLLTYIITPGHK